MQEEGKLREDARAAEWRMFVSHARRERPMMPEGCLQQRAAAGLEGDLGRRELAAKNDLGRPESLRREMKLSWGGLLEGSG